MATKTVKKVHTISLLVANKPGVLVRVALVFARRGYNIDALVVSPAIDERFSRMTITAQGDPETLDQIIKQCAKLIDVIHASEHTDEDALHKELALAKVKNTVKNGTILTKIVKEQKAKFIEKNDECFVIQFVGTTEEIDAFEQRLKKYNLLEVVRSGKLVISKGLSAT